MAPAGAIHTCCVPAGVSAGRATWATTVARSAALDASAPTVSSSASAMTAARATGRRASARAARAGLDPTAPHVSPASPYHVLLI